MSNYNETEKYLGIKSSTDFMQIEIEYMKETIKRYKDHIAKLEKTVTHFEKILAKELVKDKDSGQEAR